MKRVALIGVFIGAVLTCSTAQAASFNGIGIAPGTAVTGRDPAGFHYRLAPFEERSDTLKLINDTNETKTLELTVTEAIIMSNNSLVCSDKALNTANIILNASLVTVASNSTQLIPLSIKALANGDEFNACLTAQESKQLSGVGVPLKSRLAMRLSIIGPGKPIVKTELSHLSAIARNRQIDVTMSIENKTGTSTVIVGDASLRNWFSNETKPLPRKVLLPKATIDQTLQYFQRPIIGGWYELQVRTISSPALRTAQQSGSEVTALYERTLFIWPHPLVLIALSFLIITFVVGLAFKKSRRSRTD